MSVPVNDYNEAVDFYPQVLNIHLREDTALSIKKKRWVVVGPESNSGTCLLLAKATLEEQAYYIDG